MQVIPVIDLLGGCVVRGVAGRREEYRSIQSSIASDARPATVAQALAERFGFNSVYVADLDAIMHGQPDMEAWTEIARAGLQLWLDAGTGTLDDARRLVVRLSQSLIDYRLIVGLESLESAQALVAICRLCGERPPVFSLDLRHGQSLGRNSGWSGLSPLEIARQVNRLGVRELIVLDLADVGVGGGTRTLELCRQIADDLDLDMLAAGGGVRGLDDLQALADAGCTAALVASALHDGKLTRADIDLAVRF